MPDAADADGLESVTLAKPWLDYSIGDTVRVDPVRHDWMCEHGYDTDVQHGLSSRPHPDFPGLSIETAPTDAHESAPELESAMEIDPEFEIDLDPDPELALPTRLGVEELKLPPIIPDLSLPEED